MLAIHLTIIPEIKRDIMNKIHSKCSSFPVLGSIGNGACSLGIVMGGVSVVAAGIVVGAGSVVIGGIVVGAGSVVVVGAAVVVGGADHVTVVETVFTTPFTVAVAV